MCTFLGLHLETKRPMTCSTETANSKQRWKTLYLVRRVHSFVYCPLIEICWRWNCWPWKLKNKVRHVLIFTGINHVLTGQAFPWIQQNQNKLPLQQPGPRANFDNWTVCSIWLGAIVLVANKPYLATINFVWIWKLQGCLQMTCINEV